MTMGRAPQAYQVYRAAVWTAAAPSESVEGGRCAGYRQVGCLWVCLRVHVTNMHTGVFLTCVLSGAQLYSVKLMHLGSPPGWSQWVWRAVLSCCRQCIRLGLLLPKP